jgi:cysteine desulfurase/selenocysteine lyase
MSVGSDIADIRKEFTILHQRVRGNDLVYFDNAATTQKPDVVISSIVEYYQQYNSNVHRGAHYMANLATGRMEEARQTIQSFVNAVATEEIIFTQGTTDGINLVAQAWGNVFLNEGDEILIAASEHHANIVPWQLLCQRTKAVLRIIPLNEDCSWVEDYGSLLTNKTKLVAVGWVSNATGVVHPVKEMIQKAHAVGAKVLIDAAQAVSHFPIDVQDLNCDWLVFSGHKIFGPTGIGVLYGKSALLNAMDVYRAGGEMIDKVSFSGTTFNQLPFKFEAGTPHIEGIIAMAEGIRWWNNLGWDLINQIEKSQQQWMSEVILNFPEMRWIGIHPNRVALYSFVHETIHPSDIGSLLDQQGIAIRTGHHCTQPLWDSLGLNGSARASLTVYNSEDEVGVFSKALRRSIKMMV